MARLTDEDMMLRSQQGDDHAFEFLFEKYRGPIFNFIFRMLNHERDAAEDLLAAFGGGEEENWFGAKEEEADFVAVVAGTEGEDGGDFCGEFCSWGFCGVCGCWDGVC